MRYIRPATQLFLAALVAVGLSACDFSDQNYDIEPGDALEIRADDSDQVPDDPEEPSTAGFQRFVPDGASSFYIVPFTIEKEYTWAVTDPDGNEVEYSTRREGEFMDVTFEEPGTYTIDIESTGQGDEYSGSFDVDAIYPEAGMQGGRYSALVAALGASSFADTLADNEDESRFTVLAPTSDALVDAFGETDDGDVNLPTAAVLWDVAKYHVLTDSLESGQVTGTQSTLIDGQDADVSGAQFTDNTDIPAANGYVHGIEQVLEPPFAIVDFPDQASAENDDGNQTVTVASVYLPSSGYVVIEDEDGNVVSEFSDQLDAGFENGITLELTSNDTGGVTYSAAVYEDTGRLISFSDKDGDDAADDGAIVLPEE